MSLTYAAQQSQNSARKSAAIVAVVLLHLGFLYAFTHGLNVVTLTKPLQDITAVLIPEEKPPQKALPVPKPKPVDVPLKKTEMEDPVLPPDITPPAIQDVASTSEPPITTVPTDVPPVVRALSVKHRVDPQYPAASRRAGETGTVLLTVIIAPNGVPSDVQVERSSGFAALDQAAVDAVRKWRFTVASDSSSSRVQLPITFRLEKDS